MNDTAKPYHLCSYGTAFAGELGQCQRSSYKWLEIIPGVWVAFCREHYDTASLNAREVQKTSSAD
jgi:hypothetical protein